MKDRKARLAPGNFYHVFNRANGKEELFVEEKNYNFFISKYLKYINPIAHTYSFCLMPNHFHFIIQIKNEHDLFRSLDINYMAKYFKSPGEGDFNYFIGRMLSRQFSNMFNSYAQAFNKMYDRKGNLFIRNYKRVFIDTDTYLRKLVIYIHLNPVKSELTEDPSLWKFSSYSHIISGKSTFVDTDFPIRLFDDIANFKFIHEQAMQGL